MTRTHPPIPSPSGSTSGESGRDRGIWFKYILIVIVAVLLAVGFPGDVGIPEEGRTLLGDLKYDVKTIDAPVATGMKLRVLSYLMTHGPLAPAVRRMLLNKNQFHKLRELSAQIEGSKHSPLTHPMNRHPAKEILLAADVQTASANSLLKDFTALLESSSDATDFSLKHARRTCRFYHQQFKAGVLPSKVIAKTLDKIKQWEKEHKLNIFSAVVPQDVMQAAYESDERYAAGKPLSLIDGVPIAVKDMIMIKNHMNYNGKSPLPEHKDGHIMPEVVSGLSE